MTDQSKEALVKQIKETQQKTLAVVYELQKEGKGTSFPVVEKEYQGRGNEPLYTHGGRNKYTSLSKY